MQKQLIRWTLNVERNEKGHAIRGRFQTPVQKDTQGAVYIPPRSLPSGNYPEKWVVYCNTLSGKLVWADLKSGKFGDRVELYVEGKNLLHCIGFPIENNETLLHGVLNGICGEAAAGRLSESMSFQYNAYAKKDKSGNFVLNDKGNPKTMQFLNVVDAALMYDKDKWMDVEQDKALMWTRRQVGSKSVLDTSAYLSFWVNWLRGVQIRLIEKNQAMPFCYESYIAAPDKQNPYGGHRLSDEKIQWCQNKWADVKLAYKFGASQGVDGDDVFAQSAKPDYDSAPEPMYSNHLPIEEPAPSNHIVGGYEMGPNDDLPF